MFLKEGGEKKGKQRNEFRIKSVKAIGGFINKLLAELQIPTIPDRSVKDAPANTSSGGSGSYIW